MRHPPQAPRPATWAALLTDLGRPESRHLDLGGIGTARGREHFALLFLGVASALGGYGLNIKVVRTLPI
ncbi:hypothetical protein ACIHCV_24500 [Streptomyces sp. NPDC051956]|uniref:hypothetical protein n=1 Tax=Streptomyces sp. NPDC051956 TaxID=3365677 RepID=UPI0037D453AD